ncbi:hypothetical protein MRX96_055035 [Rhipicephalus microplus]
MSDSGLVGTLLRSWQLMYVVAVPLLLLPLPFYMQNKAGLSAYAMLWMAFYWTAEPIPLPVTALMPLVLFPHFGVLTTAETTKMYFNNIGFVMFGSLGVAAAVEVSNLHRRLAIGTLLTVGTSNHRAENELHVFQMRKVMLLSVAYAANIGGTGSVIGTPPNLILQALYIKQFNQDDLTFLAWMLYNVPPMLVCTSLAWLYTQWIVAKLTPKGTERESREKIKLELERRYSSLGPMK